MQLKLFNTPFSWNDDPWFLWLKNQFLKYLTERFCQDSLENYFGKQHSSGARKDNPSLYDSGDNGNTIRNQKVFQSVATDNVHNEHLNFEIDTVPVPCRKKYKQSNLWYIRKSRTAIRYLNSLLKNTPINSYFNSYTLKNILLVL